MIDEIKQIMTKEFAISIPAARIQLCRISLTLQVVPYAKEKTCYLNKNQEFNIQIRLLCKKSMNCKCNKELMQPYCKLKVVIAKVFLQSNT